MVKKTFLGKSRVNLKDALLAVAPAEPRFPMALMRAQLTGSRESADKICNHEFDLLGSGLHKLGVNIDWQKDFAYDGRHTVPPRGRNSDGSRGFREIKIPWELSRFQFLPTLIKAYETHNDEKYALEAKNLIHDWMLKNPVNQGVNWQCAMEAAIRACNFALAWNFLKNSPPWQNEKFRNDFLRSIAEHGRFILRNLEFRLTANTNHLIADYTGLLFLGILFPQFKEARKWLATGLLGIENEIKEQVYDDGVDYEASIPYHRLICELFGHCALLCRFNKIPLSGEFTAKLEKMFEFAVRYTKPNGLAPQIGDNDDGRLFIFEDFYNWERRDHRHLFKLAAELFPLNNFLTQEVQNSAKPSSKGFNESRIYIMRKNDFYCIVDAGDVGQNGHGGHAHNDTLSFELCIQGEDFIIDPGTYVYNADPQARCHFRGTKMHNIVTIDDLEMNRFKSYTLFSIHNDAVPQINKWDSTEKWDTLDACHTGYLRQNIGVTHYRNFHFDKNALNLRITDHFDGKGSHNLEWDFHFAPGITTQKADEKIILEKNGKRVEMTLPKTLAAAAQIVDGETSPRYGIKENAKVLAIKHTCDISKEADVFEFSFKAI